MAKIKSEVRHGAYHDSIVLLQLQQHLASLPGVVDAGAVMATAFNLGVLADNGLSSSLDAGPEDLLLVVKAASDRDAAAALATVDEWLSRRRRTSGEDFRPRSLAAALEIEPAARWVSVSVPGRYACRLTREALELGCHVFLFSDNLPLDEEIELKQIARERRQLLLGPDCGTSIVGGVGLGFANRVRRGQVGIVGASGSGMQLIVTRLHQLGSGVSHAIGTGSRDLRPEVGASTTLQAIDLLSSDAATTVLVVLSKPAVESVTHDLLNAARRASKPVVFYLQDSAPPTRRLGRMWFATSLEEASELAARLAAETVDTVPTEAPMDALRGRLRALFGGGTLAIELARVVRVLASPVYSNLELDGVRRLDDLHTSVAHTILDLGADELTLGRPHPMIDLQLLCDRLRQEASDSGVELLVFDVVLGDGSHADPARALEPVLREVARKDLQVAAVIVGSEGDPQVLSGQIERLSSCGVTVFERFTDLVRLVESRFPPADGRCPAVALEALDPSTVVNIGLESFYDSLRAQEVGAVHVDWRPPAGGNERLSTILEQLKRK